MKKCVQCGVGFVVEKIMLAELKMESGQTRHLTWLGHGE